MSDSRHSSQDCSWMCVIIILATSLKSLKLTAIVLVHFTTAGLNGFDLHSMTGCFEIIGNNSNN